MAGPWTSKGRAMSKSLGIGVEPEEVISKYGADVLRLVGVFGRFRRRRPALRHHPDSV